MPDHPFSQEIIPNIQSKPSLVHLVADSSHPATCCLREETDPQWSAFASELHVAECCGETGIHQPTLISMKLCPFNLGESVVTLLLFSLAWSEYNFLWVFLVSLDAVNALCSGVFQMQRSRMVTALTTAYKKGKALSHYSIWSWLFIDGHSLTHHKLTTVFSCSSQGIRSQEYFPGTVLLSEQDRWLKAGGT